MGKHSLDSAALVQSVQALLSGMPCAAASWTPVESHAGASPSSDTDAHYSLGMGPVSWDYLTRFLAKFLPEDSCAGASVPSGSFATVLANRITLAYRVVRFVMSSADVVLALDVDSSAGLRAENFALWAMHLPTGEAALILEAGDLC